MSNDIKVDILFYIEEGEIVMDSPQLGVICVEAFPEIADQDLDNVAIGIFNKRLDRYMAKFQSKEHYISTMIGFGHLDKDNDGNLKAKGLDYFLDNFKYLKDFMTEKGLRRIEHTVTL